MDKPNLNPDDAKLAALLRESRAAPSLPPRFQENVWRRIERANATERPAVGATWLDSLAVWILRPRLAFAFATVLLLTGLSLGWSQGQKLAQDDAQARYVAAVAPNLLR
jgi:hypothetical protein